MFSLYEQYLSSEQDFRRWGESAVAETAFRRRLEASLSEGMRTDEVRICHGYCFVCQRHSHFRFDLLYSNERSVNWRERLVCTGCDLNNRLRLAVHAFARRIPEWTTVDAYLTEQLTSLAKVFRARSSAVVCSEFLGPDVKPGTTDSRGTRHEDLTRLSFEDARFQAVLSFDVLEHVPNYLAALKEIRRVLRPGGLLLLSVPFHPGSTPNIVRARLDETGQVAHLLAPEYHGDPVSPSGGILCFYHFGWQLLKDMESVGFSRATATLYWSSDYAYIGDEQLFIQGIA